MSKYTLCLLREMAGGRGEACVDGVKKGDFFLIMPKYDFLQLFCKTVELLTSVLRHVCTLER